MATRRPPEKRPKKRIVRRRDQTTRLTRQTVQLGFLFLSVWIGARFYFFVRYYETGGQTVFVPRPPGVEGWLPIAALMNLKFFLFTGVVPPVHPAGMVLLIAFLLISLTLRKAFCSWVCPVGTVSEWLWQGGQAIFGRNLRVPKWLDVPLRGLKYLLLGLFLYAVGRMAPPELEAFLETPYGMVADVKMLNFFRDVSVTAAVVLFGLVVLSVLVKNAWCRYLCPYGGLMGLVALLSPARIRRDPVSCIDCGKCAAACPSSLPVDITLSVRSAECTGCMDCVAICPVEGALDLALPRRRQLRAWMVATLIVAIFAGLVLAARLTGHWATQVAPGTYERLIPNANSFSHPM